MFWPEATLFTRENLFRLTETTQVGGDDLEEHLTSVCHETGRWVVTTIRAILLLVDRYDGDILPFLRHPTPPPNVCDGIVETTQSGITIGYNIIFSNSLIHADCLSVRQGFHCLFFFVEGRHPSYVGCVGRSSTTDRLRWVNLVLSRMWNHCTQHARMSSISLSVLPFSSQM